MNKAGADSKFKEYRESNKIEIPEPKDYSSPSNREDLKHIEALREGIPYSEIPGNDR